MPMSLSDIKKLLQQEVPNGVADMTPTTLSIIAEVSHGNMFLLWKIIEFIKKSNVSNINSVAVCIRDNSLIIFMLDKVSEKQRMVLKAASVIGETFEVDILEEVMSRIISRLVTNLCSSLARKGLLTSSSPGVYVFSSPLIRKFVYDLVPQRYICSWQLLTRVMG